MDWSTIKGVTLDEGEVVKIEDADGNVIWQKGSGAVPKIFCSANTTWLLKDDGTLWGCGEGDYGQQGSGSSSDVTSFTQRLTGVASVACSEYTTWTVRSDGTLWGCGRGNNGQQGSGDTADVTSFTDRTPSR